MSPVHHSSHAGHRPPTRPEPAWRLLAAVTALALLVVACSDGSDEPLTAENPSAAATTASASEQDPAPTLPAAGGSTNAADGGSATSADGATTGEDDPPAEAAPPWDQLPLALAPVGAMSEPTALTARPGSDDLWLTERVGRVRLIERTLDEAAGTETLTQVSTVVLDIADRVDPSGEGGLLGLTFSADGSLLYLHYTDREFYNVVSEFPIGAETADPGAERILLRIEQPFSNHNGGDLHLGPDGLLYASVGDGGSSDDPLGSGQDTTTLLATLLRIDPAPTADRPYTVPDDNPFVGRSDGAPEIWAWGLRNPYRFSFDAITGDLWIGDVGQNKIEEIDLLPAVDGSAGRGANLGWNLVEGDDRFTGDPPPDHVPPIHTYSHDNGRCSVTGGYVHRAASSPSLSGVYIFADYCSNEIFGLRPQADGSAVVAPLILDRAPTNVISFGQGSDGEVYVLEQQGRISRLQPADRPLVTTLSSR